MFEGNQVLTSGNQNSKFRTFVEMFHFKPNQMIFKCRQCTVEKYRKFADIHVDTFQFAEHLVFWESK